MDWRRSVDMANHWLRQQDAADETHQRKSGGAVWDKPRPKKLGKPKPLSDKEKSSAKAMAKAAGRPYPNLVDNMRAARSSGGVIDRAMDFVRRQRAFGGDLEGDVQFAPEEDRKEAPLPIMAREFTPASAQPLEVGSTPVMAREPVDRHVEHAMQFARDSQADELRRAAEQPSYADYFSGPLKYGVQTMVSPDIAPQRVAKALVEAPETAKQFGQGLAQSAYSGATLPGDVAMGKVDPMSEEGFKRAQDLAGLAQTGSFAFTRPAGALASGMSREEAPAATAIAEMGHNNPPYQRFVNPAGFYSHGHEVAMTQLPEGPRTWQEMQALLQKGSVKKEELKWAGLHPEAYDPSHKITREEIAQQFERNFPQVEPVWKRKEPQMSQDDIARVARYRNNLDNAQRALTNANQEIWHLANPGGVSEYPRYPVIGRDEPMGLTELRQAIREGNFDLNKIANPEHREIFQEYQDAFNDYQLAEAQMQEAQQVSRRQSAGDPKWEQYTYPGGSDYSESILKIPYNNPATKFDIHPDIAQKYAQDQENLNLQAFNLNKLYEEQKLKDTKNFNDAVYAYDQKYYDKVLNDSLSEGLGPEDAMARAERLKETTPYDQMENYLGEKRPYLFDFYGRELDNLQKELYKTKDAMDLLRTKQIDESRGLANIPNYTKQLFQHQSHLGDIENPLLHQRWKNRIGAEGEKILSEEETQSDIGQQGREAGFKDPFVEKQRETLINNLEKLRNDRAVNLSKVVKEHNATDPFMIEYNKLIEPIKKEFYGSKQLQSNVEKYNAGLQNAGLELEAKGFGSFEDQNNRLKQKSSQYYADYEQQVREIENQINSLPKRGETPLFPHVGSTEQWTELAAKNALAHALENDYDKIFIMGGQEQARRWQNALRQSVDNIRWEPSKPPEYPELSSIIGHPPITDKSFKTIYARPKGQSLERMFVVDKDGKVIDSDIGEAKDQKLSAVVGSDLAKKVMSQESGDVPMKDYIMGSEGYTQHYERKMPSTYKDIIKKYLKVSPKVEAGPLLEQGETPKPKGRLVQAALDQINEENPPWGRVERQGYDTYRVVRPDGTFSGGFSQEGAERALQQAKKEYEENQNKPKGPKTGPHGTYIYITPEMREAYRRIKEQQGAVFPGYKDGGAVDRRVDSAMNFARRNREKGGELEGDVQTMDTPEFEKSGSLMVGRYGEDRPQPNAHEFVQQQLRTGEPQLPQYDPEAGIETAKEAAHIGAYLHPATRPFAQAYDAYNAARDVMQSPKDPYAWGGLGLSTLFPGSGKATKLAGAAAAGAGAMGPDEAQAGPNTKFLTDLAHFYRSHYDPTARIFGAPTTIKGNRTVAKNWLSDVKLSRPIEEMSVMSRNHRPMVAEKFLEPQEMAGKAMITGLGDRTPAGYELTHLNEEEFADPVNFMGGMGFGRDIASQGKDRSVWGSAKTRAQAISNAAKRAADEGMEPIFTFVAQGPQSGDFSHHMQDIILNQLKQHRMDNKLADFIDRRMRENQTASGSTFAPKPNWVGVRSPDMAERMRQRADERVKLIKLMDAAAFRDAPGFADVGAARFASTDPSLMFDPSFSAGKSFSTINPRGEIVTNPLHPHPSYNTQISAGDTGHGYLGRFEYELPPEIQFKNYRENQIAERLRGKPLDKQTMSILKQAPTVVGTPEWVDMSSEYQDIMRRMYGRRRP